MGDSYFKKENAKKKTKKKQEKLQRREDRKVNNNKGKDLEDMIIYVDINGNFTSVPPHLQTTQPVAPRRREEEEPEDALDSDKEFTGIVTYVSEKGYGFITEDTSNDSVFFHHKQLSQQFNKHDSVIYNKEKTDRGDRAINIKKK